MGAQKVPPTPVYSSLDMFHVFDCLRIGFRLAALQSTAPGVTRSVFYGQERRCVGPIVV